MSPSYADTVKLGEDNYFHWDFNMRMKLSRNGLLAHIIKPEFDALSDRSTVQWKTDDLKALGVIAGDQFNRNTLKNRLIVTKKLHNFKMESDDLLENAPNMTLEYAIQALSGVDASDESSSAQQKAFVAKNSYDKRRFNGKCFYCKKPVHKERSSARRRPTRNAGKSRGRHPTTRSRLRVPWARLNGSSTLVQGRT
ncbi:hypothetical protein PR001_g30009 [Phytophthora rubi]|uniref:Uncharacterized protein n=1 Tax=Phytophthora rubi TaxID=129364 RepID=A0A6A3GX33_9STRA|nr:hypothetical protein PR001_g30009 [Phytophthora rubi]